MKYAFFFCCSCYGANRDLPVLTHSFPTRRSSDLPAVRPADHRRSGDRPDPVADAATPALPLAAGADQGPAALRSANDGQPDVALQPRYAVPLPARRPGRSEEHTSELQSLMRISYAVFCLKKKNTHVHQLQT